MMKSKRKFKNTMKQMTMKTQLQTTKISGFSKSSPKRKIHSNTSKNKKNLKHPNLQRTRISKRRTNKT